MTRSSLFDRPIPRARFSDHPDFPWLFLDGDDRMPSYWLVQEHSPVDENRRMFHLIVICLVMFFAGLVLHFSYPEEWWLAPIMPTVGDALMVAAILAFTVDRWLKKRLVDEVVRDVAPYVIGWRLPGVFHSQLRQLIAVKLVRTAYAIHYRLRPDNAKMKVEVKLSYRVKNYSPNSERYRAYLGIENIDNPTFVSMDCRTTDSQSYLFTPTNIPPGCEIHQHPARFLAIHGKEIEIASLDAKSQTDCYMVIQYAMVLPLHYHDIVAFPQYVHGVTIEVDCPPDFEIFPDGDANMKQLSPNKWEFEKLFLPGQYVGVRWFPKSQSSKPMISSSDDT